MNAFDLLEDRHDLKAGADRGAQGGVGEHPAQEPSRCTLNEHMEHPEGDVVFRHACKMGLEGDCSKRLGSRYRSGRSPDWRKPKRACGEAGSGRGLG